MKVNIIAALLAQGYRVLLRPYELNIVGIRSKIATRNAFCDHIYILYKDERGQWQEHSYPATTDPGAYWLEHPGNVNGTAILKAGQYVNSHMLGLHRDRYTALVQRSPVTVIRDANRNSTADLGGKEETGLFGINIHRASATGTTSAVDKYSAGCQVFANADDFTAFIGMCERHSQLYGNRFTYTLLNEAAL